MSDKSDKVLRPLDWIGITVMGIIVVALLGWTFSSAEGKQRTIEKVLSTEGCTAIGVAVDEGARTRAENNLRTIYTCADGRMVIK